MELKPCPYCGVKPVQETKRVMLSKIEDGGYPIAIGRYRCPLCGFAPSWGKSYSVSVFGFCDNHIEVWNKVVNEERSKP